MESCGSVCEGIVVEQEDIVSGGRLRVESVIEFRGVVICVLCRC